jgi:hypothetical protein
MKNKGITYIALGIGAGFVAYYLFCRKKAKAEFEEVLEQQQEPQKETRKGTIGGGGGFAPASPITSRPLYATPVATTPLSVNVTTTSTPTPTPTTTITAIKPTPPTITDTPTPTITPIRDNLTPVMFVDEGGTRPILTTKPTPPTTTTTTTPVVSKEVVPYRLQETPLMIEEKPILNTAVRETIAPQITQLQATKQLAFDGSKTIAFEVGGCLNDL